MADLTCGRCGHNRAGVESVPYPDELAAEIRRKVCAFCWDEWQQAEVIVINELRLDFMNPRSQDILVQHMREFLCLDAQRPDPQ